MSKGTMQIGYLCRVTEDGPALTVTAVDCSPAIWDMVTLEDRKLNPDSLPPPSAVPVLGEVN